MNHSLQVINAVLAVIVGGVLCWLAWGYSSRLWRHHLQRQAVEFAMGNSKLRRRLAGLTIKGLDCREAVVPAETMRGWVWVRVAGRKPRRGERPLEAHDEQIGWALTRRGALRKMSKTARPQREDNHVLLT